MTESVFQTVAPSLRVTAVPNVTSFAMYPDSSCDQFMFAPPFTKENAFESVKLLFGVGQDLMKGVAYGACALSCVLQFVLISYRSVI